MTTLINPPLSPQGVGDAPQARSLLAAIVDSSDDGIISKSLNGVITSWNSGAEKIFGYLAAEVIGKSVAILAVPGERENYALVLERVRRGERIQHFETLRKTKTGRVLPVSISVSPILDDAGQIIGAAKIVRDISVRKQTEDRLLTMLETLRDAFVVIDRSWNFAYVNTLAAQIAAREPAQLLGRTLWEVFPLLTGTNAEQAFLKAMDEQLATTFEFEHASGSWFQVDVYPSSEGLFAYGRDISKQKVAEAERVESELRYRALSASTSDAIVMHVDGRVIDSNDMFTRMFGYTNEDLLGANAMEVLATPESHAVVQHHVLSNSSQPYEATLRRKDGTTVVVEVAGRTIQYKGQSVRISSAHDITARKRAELLVQAAEAQLRLITDTVPALISYITPDLRYRLVNEAYQKWFGKPRHEIVGKTMQEIVGDRAWSVIGPNILRCLTGEVVQFESEVHYHANRPRWISATYTPDTSEDGTILGIVVLVADVTNRKLAEAAQERSEKRLALALSAARMMAWETDIDGLRTIATEESLQFWGFREGTAADFARQVHPEDRSLINQRWQDAVRSGGEYLAEYRVARPDGERWYISRGQVAQLEDGTKKMVGVTSDVTVLKRAEAALRTADRRKDEFLAMLAHELRNPLSAIANGAQLLKIAGGNHAAIDFSVDVIVRQSRHLARLIDDLLDVSRITRKKIRLQKELLDARSIIEQAVQANGPLFVERRHTVVCSLPDTSLTVEADATRLEQILTNLLINAAKYTEAGGTIEVVATALDSQLEIRVKDNGVGIPKEQLHEMFELFVQGDRTLARSEGGLGIGLTLVRSLVEMHGGSVTAHSKGVNLGSEFIVLLPLATAQTLEPVATPAAPSSKLQARRVLIVDDNQDTAQTLAQLLSLHGHDVQAAFCGVDALEIAQSFLPEIVLLDIGLPGMDGYEVARQLRLLEALKRLKIIAISGYTQSTKVSTEINAHLVKPVDQQLLLSLIDSESKNG